MGDMSEYHGDPSHTPPRPKAIRILLAHPKAMTTDEIERFRAAVMLVAPNDARITTGRDEFEAHFTRCGSWDTWAADVAVGIHPVSREPRYTHFVTPGTRVGAATAKILLHALSAGKKVASYDNGTLTRRHSVIKVSSSPQNGWELR